MPTSVFFNNNQASMEQRLLEDLSVEVIRIHGVDFYYLPRTIGDVDQAFNEAPNSSYNAAYLIDVYVKDYNGFQGEDLLNKFSSGPPLVTDNFTLVVARKTFLEEVGDQTGQVRPLEGDLMFFPFNQKVYKITFVEHESIFYQLGTLQVWEMSCALFDYSGETFDTGIPEVDAMTDGYDINLLGQGLLWEPDGGSILDEAEGVPILFEDFDDSVDEMLGADNDYYQVEGLKIIDFSEIDPFANPDGKY